MKAYEYKLVDGSISTLESQVNELAQEGWSLVGPAQVRSTTNGPYYTQTLTRPTEQLGSSAK